MQNQSAKQKWPPKLPNSFPLTLHPRGYVVSMNGRTRWIAGKVSPAEALRIYHAKAAADLGGAPVIAPKRQIGPATVRSTLTRWILDCRAEAERGDLSPHSYADRKRAAKRIAGVFGEIAIESWTPDHTNKLYTDMGRRHGADFAKRALGFFRQAARYAEDMKWCPPVSIGHRLTAKLASRPAPRMKWKLFTPEQIAVILRASVDSIAAAGGPAHRASREQRHAMILLCLNGGEGAKELSDLQKAEIDIQSGVLDHSRVKTDKEHIVPLWPETLEALKPVLAQRPDDPLLFRTRQGSPWCRIVPILKAGNLDRANKHDAVNAYFVELIRPLGLKFPGQGFYKLKHLANTVADAAGDAHATFALFGHGLPGVKGHYVDVGLDRLRKVVEFMRSHLLGPYLNQQVRLQSPVPSVVPNAASDPDNSERLST